MFLLSLVASSPLVVASGGVPPSPPGSNNAPCHALTAGQPTAGPGGVCLVQRAASLRPRASVANPPPAERTDQNWEHTESLPPAEAEEAAINADDPSTAMLPDSFRQDSLSRAFDDDDAFSADADDVLLALETNRTKWNPFASVSNALGCWGFGRRRRGCASQGKMVRKKKKPKKPSTVPAEQNSDGSAFCAQNLPKCQATCEGYSGIKEFTCAEGKGWNCQCGSKKAAEPGSSVPEVKGPGVKSDDSAFCDQAMPKCKATCKGFGIKAFVCGQEDGWNCDCGKGVPKAPDGSVAATGDGDSDYCAEQKTKCETTCEGFGIESFTCSKTAGWNCDCGKKTVAPAAKPLRPVTAPPIAGPGIESDGSAYCKEQQPKCEATCEGFGIRAFVCGKTVGWNCDCDKKAVTPVRAKEPKVVSSGGSVPEITGAGIESDGSGFCAQAETQCETTCEGFGIHGFVCGETAGWNCDCGKKKAPSPVATTDTEATPARDPVHTDDSGLISVRPAGMHTDGAAFCAEAETKCETTCTGFGIDLFTCEKASGYKCDCGTKALKPTETAAPVTAPPITRPGIDSDDSAYCAKQKPKCEASCKSHGIKAFVCAENAGWNCDCKPSPLDE